MDKKLDSPMNVSVTDPASASTSTPTTAAAIDIYARRSCPRCGRRMSALQFDKHTFCVVCRDIKCSLDTRCKECKAWSKDFVRLCQASAYFGFEGEEGYTDFLSFAACNSGHYHFLSFPTIRNFF